MKSSSMRKIQTLIVGGGGFIGSHLVRLLAQTGTRNITVLGRSSAPRFPLPPDVQYISGDASNAAFLRAVLQGCDEVVDLAYATVPKTSFDDPVNDVLVNLPATVNLLQQAARFPLRRLLLVSSGGTVYGNAAYLPIDESHPTNPVSPYGITKLATEKYAVLFHKLENLPVVIVRPGNPYGPNQLGNVGQGFIGAAVFASLNRKKVPIFGERGTVRDYIHVEDLAEGLVAALEHGSPGEVYNIGTGIGMDNRAILDMLAIIARDSGFEVESEIRPPRVFDVQANVLSSARLTYVSGWRPRIDIQSGLQRTWDWALKTWGRA